MPARIGDTAGAVADKDSAETFAESDVTLSQTSTVVDSESVRIDNTGDRATFVLDGGTYNGRNEGGVVINPNESLSGIEIEAGSSQEDATSGAAIEDLSTNTVIGETTATVSSGETVRLAADMSSGQDYAVYLRDPDLSVKISSSDPAGTTRTTYDVVDGWMDGRFGSAGCISAIQTVTSSGEVTVEWPAPTDIFEWDVLSFLTEDSGTLNVYVQSDNGGWSDVAGPVSRGDSIPVSGQYNVRFRVELTRPAVMDEPTLDAIYRRYKL